MPLAFECLQIQQVIDSQNYKAGRCLPIISIILLSQWGNWNLERWNHLPKVIQLAGGNETSLAVILPWGHAVEENHINQAIDYSTGSRVKWISNVSWAKFFWSLLLYSRSKEVWSNDQIKATVLFYTWWPTKQSIDDWVELNILTMRLLPRWFSQILLNAINSLFSFGWSKSCMRQWMFSPGFMMCSHLYSRKCTFLWRNIVEQ